MRTKRYPAVVSSFPAVSRATARGLSSAREIARMEGSQSAPVIGRHRRPSLIRLRADPANCRMTRPGNCTRRFQLGRTGTASASPGYCIARPCRLVASEARLEPASPTDRLLPRALCPLGADPGPSPHQPCITRRLHYGHTRRIVGIARPRGRKRTGLRAHVRASSRATSEIPASTGCRRGFNLWRLLLLPAGSTLHLALPPRSFGTVFACL